METQVQEQGVDVLQKALDIARKFPSFSIKREHEGRILVQIFGGSEEAVNLLLTMVPKIERKRSFSAIYGRAVTPEGIEVEIWSIGHCSPVYGTKIVKKMVETDEEEEQTVIVAYECNGEVYDA